MADPDPARIEFRRSFKHDPWRDNIDRVQAEGDNGFNTRFQAIEQEFDRIGQVVDLIGRTFRGEENLLLAPRLIGRPNDKGWTHEFGYAVSATSPGDSNGVMPLALPNGSVIRSLQAVIFFQKGTLTVTLARRKVLNNTVALADTNQHKAVESIAGFVINEGDPGGPLFVKSKDPDDAAKAVVDAEQYAYFITADQTNPGANPAQRSVVFAFRVVLTRS